MRHRRNAVRPNDRWSRDVVAQCLSDDRWVRVLTVEAVMVPGPRSVVQRAMEPPDPSEGGVTRTDLRVARFPLDRLPKVFIAKAP